jgi:SAM-dependent methyltransferase
MAVDEQVTGHYGRPGMLRAILAAAERAGLDPDGLAASDLSAVDEFHLGGLAATRSLLDLLAPAPGSRLLDVGSGIGGPARVAASQYACTVTGVDLTPEFTELATDLTARVGLDDRVTFRTADAVALPFPDGSFDVATMIHVGMNMPEKARVFAEVRRVLETGGRFAIFDQMLTGTEQPAYPEPWAGDPSASFLSTTQEYRTMLSDAGFGVDTEEDRTQAGIDFFTAMRAASEGGPPPFGLHVLFGPEWPVRAGNNLKALEDGTLAATVMVARAV